jgi:hypothetical protein
VVKFRKVSKSHGDRSKADDVLNVLRGLRIADLSKGREIPQTSGNEGIIKIRQETKVELSSPAESTK